MDYSPQQKLIINSIQIIKDIEKVYGGLRDLFDPEISFGKSHDLIEEILNVMGFPKESDEFTRDFYDEMIWNLEMSYTIQNFDGTYTKKTIDCSTGEKTYLALLEKLKSIEEYTLKEKDKKGEKDNE